MEDLFVRWGKGRDAQTPDKSTDRSREAQSTESSTDFSPEAQPPGGKTGLSRDAKRRPSRRNRRGKEAAQDSDQAKESIGKTRTQRTQDSGGKSRAVTPRIIASLYRFFIRIRSIFRIKWAPNLLVMPLKS